MSEVYELVNPSDYITISHDDKEVLFVVCILLGGGMCALRPISNDNDFEVNFCFGEEGLNRHSAELFSEEFEPVMLRVINTKKQALIDCFMSLVYGNRSAYESALQYIPDDKKESFWYEWNDQHRSSMNNFHLASINYVEQFKKRDLVNNQSKDPNA